MSESRPAMPTSDEKSTRRRFLTGAGTFAGATLLSACAPNVEGDQTVAGERSGTAGNSSAATAESHRTRLVLLGTAGGPAVLGDGRKGISTAVVYDGKAYIVDLGHGAQMNLHEAGIGGDDQFGGSLLTNVRGIFFTHLHSDHVVEWPGVYATGPLNIVGKSTEDKIQVFGPGDRQTLVRMYPPDRQAPELYDPDSPTSGIRGMTDQLRKAFSTDFNDRARDSNFAGPGAVFEINEIALTGTWDIKPEGIPPRLAEPIHVWQDGDVRVSATLVDHRPTAPAFAFRFDTPDGSVVISGDTAVSENLMDLAKDCDYLVHEVLDEQYAQDLTAKMPPEVGGPLKEHLLVSHTTIEQVGRDVAEPCGAKNLVLHHLLPANNPRERWKEARNGYSGNLIVGEDLMALGVGAPG